MQETFNAIVALTDAFCRAHLHEEYAQLARQATAALCRKRPSPLATGHLKTWACGIVYALGSVNFLFCQVQGEHVGTAVSLHCLWSSAVLVEKFVVAQNSPCESECLNLRHSR